MEQVDWNLSIEEKKAQFRKATVTHRLLEQTHRAIMRAVREPAGFVFLLVHGPTGVGKTRMIETIAGQIKEMVFSPSNHPLSAPLPHTPTTPIPVLVIEAAPRTEAPSIAATTIGAH